MPPPIVWSPDPTVLAGVIALSLVYVAGWRRARRPGEPHPPGYGRLALFAASMASVLAALVSPIDDLSDDVLAIHMVQHLLLLDLVPILMILSLTKGILRPVARSLNVLERRAGVLAHPAFALLLYVAIMYLWHVPAMYDLALEHSGVHVLEHLCFAAAGTLYWWQVLSPLRGRMRVAGMGPVVYMVSTKLLVGMLGVILAFAPASFYSWYQHHPHYWGLSARVDENIAGLVMALEQSIVMGIALTYLVVRMLSESEREAQRAERYGLA